MTMKYGHYSLTHFSLMSHFYTPPPPPLKTSENHGLKWHLILDFQTIFRLLPETKKASFQNFSMEMQSYFGTKEHGIVLYCIVLYCVVLYCIVS